MKVVLRSSFSQFSGYGRDGIGLARALLDRGHDVRLSPHFVSVPLPRDIAGLLTHGLDAPFDIAIHHREPELIELAESDARVSRVNVAWSMWEWKSLQSQSWSSDLADRLSRFDHVVAYDQGSAQAFAPYVEETRLKVVQGGFESEDWGPPKKGRKDPEQSFTFGMNGRLSARKGHFYTIKAFQLLQERHGSDFNARLVLRSTQPIFPPGFPGFPGVETVVATALPPELRDFYQSLDCLVSPSLGEGKNLPALEALATGTPVILSDLPAHRQWATSQLVSWVPTHPYVLDDGLEGLSVSVEDLADVMWHHYTHGPEESLRAQRAARTVSVDMDWSRCLERLSLVCDLRL